MNPKFKEPEETMTLPTFSECYEKAMAGTASTLEKFIANFEPERDRDADVFREQLAELIYEASAPVRSSSISYDMKDVNQFFWNPETNQYESKA